MLTSSMPHEGADRHRANDEPWIGRAALDEGGRRRLAAAQDAAQLGAEACFGRWFVHEALLRAEAEPLRGLVSSTAFPAQLLERRQWIVIEWHATRAFERLRGRRALFRKNASASVAWIDS